MPSRHARPIGHSGCLPKQSGHFGGSNAMKTQSFENSQKSVFIRTLVVNLSMKYWISRVETVLGLLSDLRAL